MKRFGYRKSRTGCLRCKKRRVKCDEQIPCSACWKHEVPCSLQFPATSLQSFQNARGDTIEHRRRARLDNAGMSTAGATPDQFVCFSNLCNIGESGTCSNCISYAQLMHHYTAVAYRTLLTPCLHACVTLQTTVPQEAFTYPSLFHQILAFSALHLAHVQSNKRQQYLIQASQHQSAAISGTRELLAKPLTASSCHALYASSVFIIISGFAIFPTCEKDNAAFEPISSLVDVFVLIGGMSAILESSDTQLRQGPLRGLFRDCACPLPQVKGQVQEISIKATALIPLFETSGLDREEKRTLIEATALLVDTIEDVKNSGRSLATPELRAVFSWPARLSPAYLTLTRHHNPLALVVLSFFCVLLHAREDNYWFLNGWAAILLKSISRIVVDSPWREIVQWPMDIIGGVKVEA